MSLFDPPWLIVYEMDRAHYGMEKGGYPTIKGDPFWGFVSHHQNSHSCWSRRWNIQKIVGWCETWGHLPTPVDDFLLLGHIGMIWMEWWWLMTYNNYMVDWRNGMIVVSYSYYRSFPHSLPSTGKMMSGMGYKPIHRPFLCESGSRLQLEVATQGLELCFEVLWINKRNGLRIGQEQTACFVLP